LISAKNQKSFLDPTFQKDKYFGRSSKKIVESPPQKQKFFNGKNPGKALHVCLRSATKNLDDRPNFLSQLAVMVLLDAKVWLGRIDTKVYKGLDFRMTSLS